VREHYTGLPAVNCAVLTSFVNRRREVSNEMLNINHIYKNSVVTFCTVCVDAFYTDATVFKAATKHRKVPQPFHVNLPLGKCLASFQNTDSRLYGMASSGMLYRVALVSTDVAVGRCASTIRVTRIAEIGTTLALTSNRRTQRASVASYG
jgi:hypothetical protein